MMFVRSKTHVHASTSVVGLNVVAFTLLTIGHLICQAHAHGRLMEPAARNSLWRVDPWAPVNYDDNQLFCGGIGQMRSSGGRCGVCGDPFNGPREHETGGRMATNQTQRNYVPNSTIEVLVELETNHGGTFEFSMCWRDTHNKREHESCFEPLKLVGTSNGPSQGQLRPEAYTLRNDPANVGQFVMSLQLPGSRTCDACILRWDYRAANNWGQCPDGSQRVGCGLQELYRNCADISVRYGGQGIGRSR